MSRLIFVSGAFGSEAARLIKAAARNCRPRCALYLWGSGDKIESLGESFDSVRAARALDGPIAVLNFEAPVPIEYDYEGDPFPAVDADRRTYRLTPLYRYRVAASGKRLKTCYPNDCVGFRTDAGQDATGDGPGRYLILGTDPAVVLVSDDPQAVSLPRD